MLDLKVKRNTPSSPPDHHVLATPSWKDWIPYLSKPVLPPWSDDSSGNAGKGDGSKPAARGTRPGIEGFRNPWPSWRKPTPTEIWSSFSWGEDDDPAVALAVLRLKKAGGAAVDDNSAQRNSPRVTPQERADQASQLLRVDKPDFDVDPSLGKVKATWLGHAGVLVQLPPLVKGGDPVRCAFDPFFSERASPVPGFGPLRSSPPPCRVEDLPPIDAAFISHNHFDHLDYATVMALWKANERRMRFFVPLGNKTLLIGWKIPAERVVELDWWDSAELFPLLDAGIRNPATQASLRITCTPAQHSSFRTNFDANASLWAGWYLSHQTVSRPASKPFRIYFAGDTGYQFHSPSSAWPPPPPPEVATTGVLPPSSDEPSLSPGDPSVNGDAPACPAFAEIARRLGRPHLLLLPVSVGGTYAYLRSFTSAYLNDSINPFPRHADGVTGAAHIPAWDAVRVMRIMTDRDGDGEGDEIQGKEDATGGSGQDEEGEDSVALAIHWGTFVTDPVEVLRTLGQLEWACYRHGLSFSRGLDDKMPGACDGDVGGGKRVFVALHQGHSVLV